MKLMGAIGAWSAHWRHPTHLDSSTNAASWRPRASAGSRGSGPDHAESGVGSTRARSSFAPCASHSSRSASNDARRGGENLERLVHQRRGRRRVVAGEVGVDGFLQRAPRRANLVGGRFRGNVQDGVVVDEGDATAIRDGVVARTGRKSRIVPTTVAGARRARDDGARVADAGARRGANTGEDANIGEHRGEHREDAREGVKGRKRDVPARTSDPRHQISALGRHFLSC